jgi:predicted RNA binding protein YcfA (HicA-like mRNA interferase family)
VQRRLSKKYREVRMALSKAGWLRLRTTGSHETWGHPDGRRVTVVGGGNDDDDDVPAGTLANIRRSTSLEDLR